MAGGPRWYGGPPRDGEPDPLIVTALLDPAAMDRFEAWRQAWFPPGRNIVPAHVSLFHRLPGGLLDTLVADVAATCDGVAPLHGRACGVRPLGGGFAVELAVPGLELLRARLARRWAPWLTAQDRQRFVPHVTVQNKADPARARRDAAEFQQGFAPFAVRVEAIAVWHYRGGPWEPAARCDLAG